VVPLTQHRARATLGYCLLRAGQPTDAEPVLLEAARGLDTLPAAAVGIGMPTVAGWLESTYTALRRPDDAAAWRARRGGAC
jgi:hypothetical protein